MDFRTQVELPKKELDIAHDSKILLLGSCFAENIGTRLLENKFRCDINPFGILYNPMSILAALQQITAGTEYSGKELFAYQGQWHSFMHHGSFSDVSREVCLENVNSRLRQASKDLNSLDYLFVTLGTAYVYRLKENGMIVSNCHKLPEKSFERRMLKVEEVVNEYTSYLNSLLKRNPGVKVLFTVSPIRHVKDGMHGNQLSKATLLLVIDALRVNFPEHVFYFPSYELMMDELRDYRFYADDMLHPSVVAVDYLWECFSSSYFSKNTLDILVEWGEIKKALNHKPFRPDSEQYIKFLSQIVLRIKRLKEKCPYLDVEKEIKLCHIR